MTHLAAETFLRAFRAAIPDGRSLEIIASDADGFADALKSDPEDLRLAIEEAVDFTLGREGSDPRDDPRMR
jgi:hypothetical protein